jgi:hypothetical protein
LEIKESSKAMKSFPARWSMSVQFAVTLVAKVESLAKRAREWMWGGFSEWI